MFVGFFYPRDSGPVRWPALPVIGGHHEVEQQPDGLLYIDLVGGGQPLVELVVDGRQDGLQPWHIDLGVVVQRVQAVVAKGFDHVPDVHQMNCANRPDQPSVPAPPCHHQWVFKNLLALTVASLLHKPEFAGGPVSRQSDYIEVLSSCGEEREQKESLQKNQMNALLVQIIKQRHSQANWEYIQTLSLCVGGIVLNVWGATYLLCNEELVREPHERTVKGRFLSVNSTHSFPWRAASSPPWPCPVYCPPRSFCGTADSRTREA